VIAPPAADATARDRREAWWLFAVALLVLGAGFGLRDPWPADEPRFVLVARQMFEGGDWWFPHRGSELYPDKPPLFFWLLAGARALVGSWRWSFLLPSLVSSLGTLWLVRDLGKRLWNPRAGLWAAVAVLSALQFVYQGKRAQIDPTLVFATTLSLYGLCRHLLLGPHWRWYAIACAAAGAGVALKGVGFLPLLALPVYAAMRWRGWQGLAPIGRGQALRWSLGALAFLAPIALWLGPVLWMAAHDGDPTHRAYLDNLLFKQTATRYAEAWHHHQPAWYFVEIIALFWLPFSLTFAWLWRDWRDAWRARDARVWLPLAWGLLVLVFFSASPGKRDMYILPALPAFALAAAAFLPALAERPGFRRALWAFVLALGLGLLAIGAAGVSGHDKATAFAAERGLDGDARALWWMLAGIGSLAVVLALALRLRGVLVAAAATLVALWLAYGFVAYPVLDEDSSARGLMQAARAAAGPDATLGLVDWKEQNLLQATGPVVDFGFRRPRDERLRIAIAWLRADPAHRRLFVQAAKGREACLRLDEAHAQPLGIANRRGWWLVGEAALTGNCE
jgi:4-amino-4-deoxy-L-arabinose transferase-like glycosyltransferase